jgi:hypothetical protein
MNAELATQPQPVQKGRVLPPEIHKAVQKWSNSFFRPSIPTNLMDKSTVTEINDERVKNRFGCMVADCQQHRQTFPKSHSPSF